MPDEQKKLPILAAVEKAIEESGSFVDYKIASAIHPRIEADPDHDWKTIHDIFYVHFRPHDPLTPFGPLLQMGSRRSFVPDDLAEEALNELGVLLGEASNFELRARIGDILWLRRRDPAAARVAIESYLASGDALVDVEEFPSRLQRYERAVRLARQLGKKAALLDVCLKHVEGQLVNSAQSGFPAAYALGLLEILAEFRAGDFSTLAIHAIKLADEALAAGNFPGARNLFEVAAKFFGFAKQGDNAEAARVSVARSYATEAEARELGGSFIAARAFWEDAILAFRERPSLRTEIPRLQGRLKAASAKSLEEMQTFTHETDISGAVKATVGAFVDLSLDEALYRFAAIEKLIDSAELRKRVLDSDIQNHLMASIEADIFDESGRKVATRPALLGADGKLAEAAIEGFMDEHARLHRGFVVHARIIPALRTITGDHLLAPADIEKLISESALIPEGRRRPFVKAIMEGFNLDFSTALHILVPQIENALRGILERLGITPESIDPDGLEQVWGFERILVQEKLIDALGSGVIYELRSLLVERIGPNIRNALAHGLLPPDAFDGDAAIYLWWLLYRMTVGMTPGFRAFIERRKLERKEGP